MALRLHALVARVCGPWSPVRCVVPDVASQSGRANYPMPTPSQPIRSTHTVVKKSHLLPRAARQRIQRSLASPRGKTGNYEESNWVVNPNAIRVCRWRRSGQLCCWPIPCHRRRWRLLRKIWRHNSHRHFRLFLLHGPRAGFNRALWSGAGGLCGRRERVRSGRPQIVRQGYRDLCRGRRFGRRKYNRQLRSRDGASRGKRSSCRRRGSHRGRLRLHHRHDDNSDDGDGDDGNAPKKSVTLNPGTYCGGTAIQGKSTSHSTPVLTSFSVED